MKNRSIFVLATLVQQLSLVLCNSSCLDNPVDWDSYLLGGGSYGVATLPLGLFIFQPLATSYNEFPHRNHPAQPAAHKTKAFPTQLANPSQLGQAFCTPRKASNGRACKAGILTTAFPRRFFHTNLLIGLALLWGEGLNYCEK